MLTQIPGKTVVHNGTVCDVYRGAYPNGRVALELLERETGEPYARATVNLPDEDLAEGEVVLKTYAENVGILPALLQAGVVAVTGRVVQSGHCTYPVCRLLT